MEGNRRQPIALYAWLICAMLGFTATAAASQYPFDDSGYLGEAGLMPGWQETLTRQAQESARLRECLSAPTDCLNTRKNLQHLIAEAHSMTERRRISIVNHYVNRKRYRRDRARTLVADADSRPLKYRSRWSTVNEFFEQGGDCEDYASTKYFLLRELGLPTDRMRVVIAFDRVARRHHAVLAVQLETDDVWLLDTDNIIRTGNHHDYRFVYSLNEVSIWDHETTDSSGLVSETRAADRATGGRADVTPTNTKEKS